MATRQTQFLARSLLTPAVGLLFIWMIVPLALTIYFSTLHYSLLDPGSEAFVGWRISATSSPIPPSSPRSRTRWCWSARCWR